MLGQFQGKPGIFQVVGWMVQKAIGVFSPLFCTNGKF
jgi:hypothetical protein